MPKYVIGRAIPGAGNLTAQELQGTSETRESAAAGL